jgi:hypothetical protein
MQVCGKCGKEVNDGEKFCGGCGAAMDAAPAVDNVVVKEVTASELDKPFFEGLSNKWAWCLAMVPLMCSVLVGIIIMVVPELGKIAAKSITFCCLPLFLIFYLLDNAELKKNEIEFGWGWIVWGILLCGFLAGPIYLFSRARNIGKYGYAIASLIAPIVGFLVLGASLLASEVAKMTDATKVIESFESAYLTALAENEDDADITEEELEFEPPTESKFFKYEYVTYAQGGIAGYKATALKHIMEFNKGNFLQTVYQEDSDSFTHCVGGNRADVSVVEELVPQFNVTVECSDVEIKKANGSASVPTQQKSTETVPAGSRDNSFVNAEGEAWTHGSGVYGYHTIILRSNGSFYWEHSYRTEDGHASDTYKGKWHTEGNKIIMITDDGDKIINPYNITSSTEMKLNLWGGKDEIEFEREEIEQ